jgi:cyclohexyl-isocyanide hydratase
MPSETRWTRRDLLAWSGAAGIGMTAAGAASARHQDPSGRPGHGAEPEASLDTRAGRPRHARVVGFPLYQGATLLDFAGATQIFKFAGATPIWLAARECPVETTEGVTVLPTHTFKDHPPIDILFVPGGGAEGVIASMFDPVFQRFLRDAAGKASWAGAVCTGAFIIAAAGLLDGCKATTYWSQIPNLKLLGETLKIEAAEGYPRYVLDPDKKRFTGGGVSSSIDLALKLVATLDGEEAARTSQLSVQYAPDPPVHAGDPGQASPALTESVRELQEDGFIAPVRKAVQQLLAGR